jgi:anti-sigma B factor antagonist
MPLLIAPFVDGATIRLALAGDVDLATAPALWDAVEKAVTADGIAIVVVDLAETTFMDCFGMSTLIRGSRLAADSGRRLRAVNAAGIPLIVLQTTGVSGILTD